MHQVWQENERVPHLQAIRGACRSRLQILSRLGPSLPSTRPSVPPRLPPLPPDLCTGSLSPSLPPTLPASPSPTPSAGGTENSSPLTLFMPINHTIPTTGIQHFLFYYLDSAWNASDLNYLLIMGWYTSNAMFCNLESERESCYVELHIQGILRPGAVNNLAKP